MIEKENRESSVLEEALLLAEHGIKTMPLYRVVNGVCNCFKGASCDSPGKHPTLTEFWDKATTDEKTLREWFEQGNRNLGILAGEENRIFTLDFDGEAGMKTLAEWRERGLPPTWEVETGSGGRHLIFAIPWNLEFEIRNTVKSIGDGVDGRGEHGYTAGPGSETNKGEYRWIYMEGDPAEPPDWLLELIREAVVSAKVTVNRYEIKVDVDWNVEPDSVLLNKIGMLLGSNAQFSSIMNGKVIHQNPSERDWALCKDMLRAGFTPQEVTNVIIFVRRGKKDNMHGDYWFPLTISKAMAHVEKELIEESAAAAFAESAATAEMIAEEKVTPPTLPLVGVFPIHVFPVAIQRFIREVCACLSVPYDFVAVHLLAVAGAAIGKSCQIEIKKGYTQLPNLYCVLVGDPGTAKSSALDKVFAPVLERQAEYQEIFEQAKLHHEQSMLEYEAEKDSWKKENRHTRGDPPSPPTLSRMEEIYTSQATTEAISEILRVNQRGCILKLDELSALLRGMNQYKGGKGDDREYFLSCWANSDIKINRKRNPEPTIIRKPALSITGNLPPQVLATLEGVREEADGFLDRFLIVYPDNQEIPEWNWNDISDEVTREYKEIITRLFDLPLTESLAGNAMPHTLPLSDLAKFEWEEWHIKHTQERRNAEFNGRLHGVFSKMTNQLGRISLILHMLRVVCGEASKDEVDERSVKDSTIIVDHFKTQARKVYQVMEVTAEEKRMQEALAWIKGNGGKATVREIQRNRIAGCNKKSDVEELFSTLEQYGYGRVSEFTPKTGGRPTKEFHSF
jgi:hypothetical protein